MQCDECKSALRKDKLTGGHWCPVCSFENAHREKLAAQSELASLRQRVAELEAAQAIVTPNVETLSKRIDAFLDANLPQVVTPNNCPSCTWRGDVKLTDGVCPQCGIDWKTTTLTPNNCLHCRRSAEKMRESAATLSDEMFADDVADAIRALPLPACDGCNPLKPNAEQANQADSLRAWADLWTHINKRLGYVEGDLLPNESNFDHMMLSVAISE